LKPQPNNLSFNFFPKSEISPSSPITEISPLRRQQPLKAHHRITFPCLVLPIRLSHNKILISLFSLARPLRFSLSCNHRPLHQTSRLYFFTILVSLPVESCSTKMIRITK
jgi:hypothetical protein